MANVHHGLFRVKASHSSQNGHSNLSGDLPLSIYRHELTKDCKVTSVHSMKYAGTVEVHIHPFLNSAPDVSGTSRAGRFIAEKKTRKPINTRLDEPQRMCV